MASLCGRSVAINAVSGRLDVAPRVRARMLAPAMEAVCTGNGAGACFPLLADATKTSDFADFILYGSAIPRGTLFQIW